MSASSDAVETLLGKKILEKDLNHYSILGIDSRASIEEIKLGLRSASAAWNANAKAHPGQAQLVANLLRQAQATLLDSEKRRIYDASLSPELRRSEIQFPNADPSAPFHAAACLRLNSRAATVSSFYGTANERWRELTQRIPILEDIVDTVIATPSNAQSHHIPSTVQKSSSDHTAPTEAISRAQELRRRRRSKQKLTTLGLIVSTFAFLGIVGIAIIWNQSSKNSSLTQTDGVTNKNGNPIRPGRNPKTIANGKPDQRPELPSLNKEENGDSATTAWKSTEPQSPSVAMTPAVQSGESTKSTETSPQVKIELEPSTDTVGGAPWTAAMLKAKEAIVSQQFGEFHDQINTARRLSRSEENKNKTDRLDQLGQLHEIFIKAFNAGKAKLHSGDTLTIGSRKVAIVEANESGMIVKINGNNEKHSWPKLPLAYAIAISDLELSKEAPTDLAARAVYCSLSGLGNEIFNQRAKDWFEKSCGKGGVRSDLPQALSDSYE